jgi:hypothetical protein
VAHHTLWLQQNTSRLSSVIKQSSADHEGVILLPANVNVAAES